MDNQNIRPGSDSEKCKGRADESNGMDNQYVEWVDDSGGHHLALIVRRDFSPSSHLFLTPQDCQLQLGFLVYEAGSNITPHIHLPILRHLVGTSELVIMKRGRARVNFYQGDKSFVTSRDLKAGDLVLLMEGGHGFEIVEDAILCELKQGPYFGQTEKEKFNE